MSDGDGRGGEGAGGNGVLQNGESERENSVLIVERGDESWRVIQGFGTRCGNCDLSGVIAELGGRVKFSGREKIFTTEDTGDTEEHYPEACLVDGTAC